MPDIFDTLEAPKRDVFDEISDAPSGDIFDQIASAPSGDWTPERIAAQNAQAETLRGLAPGTLTDQPSSLGVIGAVSDATKSAALQGNLYDVFTPRDPAEIAAEMNKTPLQNIREGLETPAVSIPTPPVTGPLTGALRGGANLLEGLSAPGNALLLPFLGAAPGIVKAGAGIAFGVPMAKHAISETLPAAGEALLAENYGEATQGFVEGIGGLALAAGGLGAGRPKAGGLLPGETAKTTARSGNEDILRATPEEARAFAEAATKIPEAPIPQTPLQAKSLASLGVETPATAPPDGQGTPPARPNAPGGTEGPTGIRNAIVDAERVERGLPARMEPLRRSFGTLWGEAMAVVDKDAAAGSKLVEEITKNPRPLKDWESALLTHEQVTRQNAFDRAVDDVNSATDEAVKTDAQARLDRSRDDVQAIYDVGQRVGTSSGQSLAARKMLVNDDYSLSRMEATTRAVVNEGKPLSPQQAADVKALHDKIAASEKKIAELETRENTRVAQSAFENILREQTKEASAATKRGKAITDFMEDQAAKARARIVARRGRLNVTVDPLNVAGLVDEAIIGASYIAKGVKTAAEWSAQMVKDFGERIRPYLTDLFERSKELHDANAKLFTEKAPRGTKKSPTERAAANASAKGIIDPQIVYDLAREKVNAGVTDLEAVIKSVHSDLEPLHPGLTEREVRDAFTGYGKTKIPSKEADLTKLRELRRLGQLVSAIEDALRKEPPKKTGLQRDKPSQDVRDKMKELQKVMREQGIETTSPEEQLTSANQARATALRNQIEDLDRQLKTGQKPPKGTPAPVTPEVERLRSERDAMKAKLEEIENPPKSEDQTRLDRDKKAIARRTEELKRRIAAGDYGTKPKKEPLMDKEKADMLFENTKAKEQYQRGLFEAQLAKRTRLEKVFGGAKEAANLSRALLTGGEFSAVLRQGGIISFSHPVRSFKTLGAMLSAFRSERNQFRIMEDIRNRANAPMYQAGKLFLHDERSMDLTKMEEKFQSRLAEKVPFISGSQRAYTVFLNKLRADSFDALANSFGRGGKITLDQAKYIAHYVNVVTGRGDALMKSGTADGLNAFLFAPRLVASRFQFISMEPILNPKFKATFRERAIIAKEYGRFLVGVGALYATAKLASQFDDDIGVEFDPRSSDFGKIRIGKTRVDPLSGLSQATVLIGRFATGEVKKLDSGKIVPIRGKGAQKGAAFKIGSNFLRSKLAPLPGFVVNVATGEDYRGKPIELFPDDFGFPPDSQVGNLLVPMTYGDIVKAIEEEGVPKGAAIGVAAVFGMGVQTYVDD